MASAAKAKMKVLLLAEEWGSKLGEISTFNRELATHMAESHDEVEVSVLVPRIDVGEERAALEHKVSLVQAKPMAGFDDNSRLSFPPDDIQFDFVVGHGVVLGRHAQVIRENRKCKWVQFVHTDPEELGMFKDYPEAISKAEKKHRDEVALCVQADCVVAVGAKLAESYSTYLRSCEKDQEVIVFTPGIFREFVNAVQSKNDGRKFRVLAFGRADVEDFSLKGYDIAAAAVSKLDDAYLVFVGAPEKKQQVIASRLIECGIPRERLRVKTFMEIREQLKQQFSQVDIAIMPSRAEGFGLVAVEAMSATLPVLVTANSGIGEALKRIPYGSQCVIDSSDANDWFKEIKKVRDKERKVRLEEARDMRDRYANKYSWKKQCQDLLEKMRRMLNADDSHRDPESSEPTTADTASTDGPSATKRSLSSSDVTDATAAKLRKDSRSCTAQRHSSPASNPHVPPNPLSKRGTPTRDELEWLSLRLESWEPLARRLGFHEGEIKRFHKNNEEHAKRALSMLLGWKKEKASGATYEVLCAALCHEFVKRRDLAEDLLQLEL